MTLLRMHDDRWRLLCWIIVLRLESWAALSMVPVAWSVSCADRWSFGLIVGVICFFVFLGGARCLYLLRVTQLLPQPCGTGLRISTARAALPPSAATTPPAPRPCLLPCMAFRHPTHMFTSLSQQLRLPPPRTRLRMNTPQLLLPTHVPSPQPPVQL